VRVLWRVWGRGLREELGWEQAEVLELEQQRAQVHMWPTLAPLDLRVLVQAPVLAWAWWEVARPEGLSCLGRNRGPRRAGMR
jgi:hypothetical protein